MSHANHQEYNPVGKDLFNNEKKVVAVCGDLMRRGKARQALDTAEHALRYYPMDAFILSQKAKAQLVMNQHERVIETTDLLLAMNPDDIPGLTLRADALLGLGFAEEAFSLAQKILALKPMDERGIKLLVTAGKKIYASQKAV